MKHVFVLDANVLKRVLKGNRTAVDLWGAILKNCHSIAVSSALHKQYMDMLRREKRRIEASAALIDTPKLVWQLLNHREKALWTSVADPGRETIRVRHTRDWFLQPLVDACKGVLVATDRNTREDLLGLTIEQALRLAREKTNG